MHLAIERERLRIGLSPERAQELEQAVRAALVEETLLSLRLVTLNKGMPAANKHLLMEELEACRLVFKAFRLHPDTSISILEGQLSSIAKTKLESFASRYMMATNKAEVHQFRRFLERIDNNEMASGPMQLPEWVQVPPGDEAIPAGDPNPA